MKKRKILCGILAALVIICSLTLFASAADTASATLIPTAVSAHSGQINDAKQIKLTEANNAASSKYKVYFDFKYYNGSRWIIDKNAAALKRNTKIYDAVYSNKKDVSMSWMLQINTYTCLFTGCSAYGAIARA